MPELPASELFKMTMSSGRIATLRRVPMSKPSVSQVSDNCSQLTDDVPVTVTGIKFMTPIKSATNGLAGAS